MQQHNLPASTAALPRTGSQAQRQTGLGTHVPPSLAGKHRHHYEPEHEESTIPSCKLYVAEKTVLTLTSQPLSPGTGMMATKRVPPGEK